MVHPMEQFAISALQYLRGIQQACMVFVPTKADVSVAYQVIADAFPSVHTIVGTDEKEEKESVISKLREGTIARLSKK